MSSWRSDPNFSCRRWALMLPLYSWLWIKNMEPGFIYFHKYYQKLFRICVHLLPNIFDTQLVFFKTEFMVQFFWRLPTEKTKSVSLNISVILRSLTKCSSSSTMIQYCSTTWCTYTRLSSEFKIPGPVFNRLIWRGNIHRSYYYNKLGVPIMWTLHNNPQ